MRMEPAFLVYNLVRSGDVRYQELRHTHKRRIHPVDCSEPARRILLGYVTTLDLRFVRLEILRQTGIPLQINDAAFFVEYIDHASMGVTNTTALDIVSHHQRHQATRLDTRAVADAAHLAVA